jgi:tRNA G18 (ribose-2'-O)-methylase SpoU
LWWEIFIDWEYFQSVWDAISKIKKDWYKIWSVELCEDSVDYKELFSIKEEKVCLIMWNEVSWVSKKLLDISDKKVIIPMRWQKESLNVSVAAWIVMYAVN